MTENKGAGGPTSRVPPQVHEEAVVGRGEVEAHTPGPQGHEEDRDGRGGLEGVEDLLPLGLWHGAVQSQEGEAVVGEGLLDEVKHGRPLGEDDGFGGGVLLPEVLQRLEEGLDLGGGRVGGDGLPLGARRVTGVLLQDLEVTLAEAGGPAHGTLDDALVLLHVLDHAVVAKGMSTGRHHGQISLELRGECGVSG